MLIDSEVNLQANLQALLAADPVMAELHAAGVVPPLRKREAGFDGLISIIMAQQLSVASAAAITGRLRAAVAPFTPEHLLAASASTLIAAGLSQPKIKASRSVAGAVANGQLALADLAGMDGDAAHAALVAVNGIGPWTADIYLLFCLGHPDVFPAGDLALQEAARLMLHLDTRPDAALMTALARRWSPHRGVAALMLWAFYAVAKAREGVIANPDEVQQSGGARPDRRWRPQRRAALASLLASEAHGNQGSAINWPDLLEALHAADPALRRAGAGAIGSSPFTISNDSSPLNALAHRIAIEPDAAVRQVLLRAAGKTARKFLADDAGAARLFAVFARIAAGRGTTHDARAAEQLAALTALEALVQRQPALAVRWRRLLNEMDAGGSVRLEKFLARRN